VYPCVFDKPSKENDRQYLKKDEKAMSRLKRNLVRRDKTFQILCVMRDGHYYPNLERHLTKIAMEIPAGAVHRPIEQDTIDMIAECASIAGMCPTFENYIPEHNIEHEWAVAKQKTHVQLSDFLKILIR